MLIRRFTKTIVPSKQTKTIAASFFYFSAQANEVKKVLLLKLLQGQQKLTNNKEQC
jgi:hypothetical protein